MTISRGASTLPSRPMSWSFHTVLLVNELQGIGFLVVEPLRVESDRCRGLEKRLPAGVGHRPDAERVNSGTDFDPDATVPVPAGGFVRRVARTPHYDGIKKGATEPVAIGIFGLAPVDLKLVDPSKPAWRQA